MRGRVEEALRLPASPGGEVTIHPNIFHAVMDTQPVLQWQVVQEEGDLRVLVRPTSEGFDAARLSDDVGRALEKAGAAAITVRIEEVEAIPKASSGKTPLIRANRTER